VSQAWLYQPVRSRLCPGTAGSGITRIAAGTANMIGEVGLHESRGAPTLDNGPGCRGATRCVAARDDDLGALSGEKLRSFAADPRRCAGNQGDLVLQFHSMNPPG